MAAGTTALLVVHTETEFRCASAKALQQAHCASPYFVSQLRLTNGSDDTLVLDFKRSRFWCTYRYQNHIYSDTLHSAAYDPEAEAQELARILPHTNRTLYLQDEQVFALVCTPRNTALFLRTLNATAKSVAIHAQLVYVSTAAPHRSILVEQHLPIRNQYKLR
ncbi:hypothetical protein ASU33_06105 [Solirubrum puertoriconensis]|uniref:Uncharacterized protein n=1 Tax=Solirubrum puertoriconensis TaxID=1751427 RepID=A0A9X0HJ62_SOLP1|nr:hypothetical protein ASU33_06105 [Solirubrum puertoriconensis]